MAVLSWSALQFLVALIDGIAGSRPFHDAVDFYSALATLVLFLHALFVLWVIFGALLTRSRAILRWLHIGSLVWGVLTELLLVPCPLTLLENWLEGKAGLEPYQGGFLLHYLDKLVYPDIPTEVLTVVAVLVCLTNLAVYARRWAKARSALGHRVTRCHGR